jgi:hypothetical protein
VNIQRFKPEDKRINVIKTGEGRDHARVRG